MFIEDLIKYDGYLLYNRFAFKYFRKAGKKASDYAYSTELTDKQIKEFCNEVIDLFYTINQDIFIATSKNLS